MQSKEPVKRIAVAHMLYGFAGAGKTTFARKLESTIGAVRFSHDEWMHRLYGANPSSEHFADYYQRVASLIWRYVEILLKRDQDVILDFGFWSRASRNEAREKITALGGQPRLYFLDCPIEVMRERVRERSLSVPDDSLWIDEHAFDLFRERFEPLAADEVHEHVLNT
jgi:predicted kinase